MVVDKAAGLMNYLVLALPFVVFPWLIVKAAKEKRMLDMILYISFIPFFFAFLLGVISGGSAIRALRSPDWNQMGGYYLLSGGRWTEVTRQHFSFVLISEIVGFVSMAAGTVISLIKVNRASPQKSKVIDHDHPLWHLETEKFHNSLRNKRK